MSTQTQNIPPIYGLMAEFENPQDIVNAVHHIYAHGYRKIDAYSPFPIEELWKGIGFHHTRLPLLVLVGGVLGGIIGYLMQYYLSAVEYPLNIGGRPLHSWPSFIPVTFEMTILGAVLSAVFGMLFLNGLPKPYHPVFNVERFALASRNSFFVVIEARDAKFDQYQTWQYLQSPNPRGVYTVEH